jgi:phospho-N-acetylmuramoyl-pentapeptide-transferase
MLTDFFLNSGYTFFASGWTQFACGFGLAFMIMLGLGRPFVRAMHAWQKKGQPISENVPESHRAKAGTPTMGGILVVLAILVSSVLFMPMANPTGWVALLALTMFAILGFVDDYKKVSSQSVKASNGLKPSTRLFIEAIFVVILAYLINKTMPAYVPDLSLAFGSWIAWPLGLFY